MRKILLTFVAALCCATSLWALEPIPASGTIGTCDYMFNSATGVLTITSSATAPEWGGEVEIDNPLHSPFAGQNALKEVIVEEGVVAIGTGAFFNCKNLEKITFSSTISSMGFSSDPYQEPAQNYMPFLGCSGLKTLVIKSHYSPDYDNSIDFNDTTNAFGFDPSHVNLYVYDGSVHNYMESGWGVFNIHSLPAIDGGTFGDGFTWKMSGDGKLTINGLGAMPDFVEIGEQPWTPYFETVKEVVIGEGITYIGKLSFAMFTRMEKVYLPSTLLSIGTWAFNFTSNLTEVVCAAIVVPTLGEEALPSDKKRYVYVWNFMVPEYQNDAAWGKHEIRPFGSQMTYLDASVSASAQADSENSLYINWLQVSGATVYVITLSADDGSFSIDITVNANGEITSYTRRAPGQKPRYMLTEEAEGWSLLINGLDCGKNYNITILAQDGQQTIATFHTSTTTITDGVEQPTSDSSLKGRGEKLIREGVLLIEKNGKTYNAQGAEVK